jgi:hypothetical protein
MVHPISLYNDETAEALHEALDEVWRNPTDVELYARSMHTADPYVLCGLAAAMHWLVSQGHAVILHGTPFSRHLEEMGFYECLPEGIEIRGVQRTNCSRNWKALLPIRNVQSDEDVNTAVGEFVENCGAARGWIKGIGQKIGEQSLAEALDNAREHSASEVGSFVGAWVYSQDGPLHLAVVDMGVGIPNHLRRRAIYREATDEEALVLAVQERVSGLEDKTRGFGLDNLRRAARDVGKSGLVALRGGSGELRVRIRGRREQRMTSSNSQLPGTWLRMEIKR